MQKRTKLTLSNAWSREPISTCKSAQWDGPATTAPRILRSVRFCIVHLRCCRNVHSTDRATGDPDIGEFAMQWCYSKPEKFPTTGWQADEAARMIF